MVGSPHTTDKNHPKIWKDRRKEMLSFPEFQASIDLLRSGKVAVLAGAGISRDSGIPIVTDFLKELVNRLSGEEDEESVTALEGVPFESTLEYIQKQVPINRLLKTYTLGNPGMSHFLLTRLATSGYISGIWTTNFDLLIEKALDPTVEFQMEEYSETQTIISLKLMTKDNMSFYLHKLHGSINVNNSVQLIMETLAKPLPERLTELIEELFVDGKHSEVLVIGYSFSDIFDINPIVKRCVAHQKPVTYICHSNDRIGVGTIRDIKDFRLPQLEGTALFCNGSDFVRLVMEEIYGRKLIPEKLDSDVDWKSIIGDWLSGLTSSEGPGVGPYVLESALVNSPGYNFDKSRRLLSLSADLNAKAGREWEQALVLIRIARTYIDEGYPDEARHILDNQPLLKPLFDGTSDFSLLPLKQVIIAIRALYTRTRTAIDLGETEYAEHLYSISKKISNSVPEIYDEPFLLLMYGEILFQRSSLLNNTDPGTGSMHRKEAKNTIQKALLAFEKIGDLEGKSHCLLELGKIESTGSNYDSAISLSLEALNIANELGLANQAAFCKTELALDYVHTNKVVAIKYALDAQTEFYKTGNWLMIRMLDRWMNQITL